jgi:predicted DNA-binding helix-hairpin-helix protein
MDTLEKFTQVSQYLRYEPAEEQSAALPPRCPLEGPAAEKRGEVQAKIGSKDVPVFHAVMPGGKRIALLKTLLTTVCERDCAYCPFRSGRDVQRTSFSPDEMAKGFMQLHASRKVEGLFLSSGVAGGGIRTQDRLLAAAEILRSRLGYRGYLHLKIMPGAEYDQVERAMHLADRVSINLEGPNPTRLAVLAPHKVFLDELLRPLEWVEQIRRSHPAQGGWKGRWPSTTTQFVVGAAGENDLELLAITNHLYHQLHLSRAYYSPFSPIPNTPLEGHPAVNPWRQHRLYQASFLLRDYGFDLEELPFGGEGNLPLNMDPKLGWARQNLAGTRLELNRASREDLLRIPGIGRQGAETILTVRRQGTIRSLEQLRKMGIQVKRASAFILLDGRAAPEQLQLL